MCLKNGFYVVGLSNVLLLQYLHSDMLGCNTVLLTVSVLSWRPTNNRPVTLSNVQQYLNPPKKTKCKETIRLFIELYYIIVS